MRVLVVVLCLVAPLLAVAALPAAAVPYDCHVPPMPVVVACAGEGTSDAGGCSTMFDVVLLSAPSSVLYVAGSRGCGIRAVQVGVGAPGVGLGASWWTTDTRDHVFAGASAPGAAVSLNWIGEAAACAVELRAARSLVAPGTTTIPLPCAAPPPESPDLAWGDLLP